MPKFRYNYFIQVFIAGLLFITLNQWFVDQKWSVHTLKKIGLHILEMSVITYSVYFLVMLLLQKGVRKIQTVQSKFILFFIWGVVVSIILVSQHK